MNIDGLKKFFVATSHKKIFINPEVGAMVISKLIIWMNELKLKK